LRISSGEWARADDLIIADDDGVLVIKKEPADSVINSVYKMIDREEKRLKEIENGKVIRRGID
jgi:4-hydroxy-4-methyl-2-oxoglutarate aldolase